MEERLTQKLSSLSPRQLKAYDDANKALTQPQPTLEDANWKQMIMFLTGEGGTGKVLRYFSYDEIVQLMKNKKTPKQEKPMLYNAFWIVQESNTVDKLAISDLLSLLHQPEPLRMSLVVALGNRFSPWVSIIKHRPEKS
jgi:hypothetical protein